MKFSDNEFIFKKCTIDHINSICKIQEEAFAHLDDPDILRKNSREVLSECLIEPHYTLGSFYHNKLIAFAILYDGGKSEENIGYDIDIEDSMLNLVANIKLVIVLPEYRGNGLQKKLILKLEKIAKEKDKKILCATVSPKNNFSIRNFELLGYKFHSCKIKYGGLKRNIYFKIINE